MNEWHLSSSLQTLHRTSASHPQPMRFHRTGLRPSQILAEGKQLHARIISSGIFHSSYAADLLPTKLTSMYALSGDMANARLFFDRISSKSCFIWNSLIRGHTHVGQSGNALHLFEEMISSGCQPDRFTFTFALKACADLSLQRTGMEIHCKAVTSGSGSDGYVQNSLVAMYMKCGSKELAGRVFDRMHDRTLVSWNSMISGLFLNGCAEEALLVFDRMLEFGVGPDCATVVSLLPVCAQLKDLQRGRRLHELVEEKGFVHHLPVRNALIDMYAKCNKINDAWRLFLDDTYQRDVISWTAMIGGCVLNGHIGEALSLSHQMVTSDIRPNAMTMAALLAASSSTPSLRHGKCVHGLCLRLNLESEIIVETALIDMYGKCGNMDFSSLAFASSSRRPATWNAVISGYTQSGQAREAIEQFKLMQVEAVCPDLATIASILPAYSTLVDSQMARNIHSHLIKTGFHQRVEVTTSLIDVYSKTGGLDIAQKLFDGLAIKDIVSWSSIIAGYGMHGHARTAILLFNQMVELGLKPNEVTFTSILYSCSHAGLVDEGLSFFSRMVEDHHMKPGANHYACVIDLLGRAGRLKEARGLISAMPNEPNHAVWGALLGACVIHCNVELGEEAAKNLFQLEPENTGNYVLLGNLYAAMGRWKDSEAVRIMMNERGLKKEAGCSFPSIGTSYHMTSLG